MAIDTTTVDSPPGPGLVQWQVDPVLHDAVTRLGERLGCAWEDIWVAAVATTIHRYAVCDAVALSLQGDGLSSPDRAVLVDVDASVSFAEVVAAVAAARGSTSPGDGCTVRWGADDPGGAGDAVDAHGWFPVRTVTACLAATGREVALALGPADAGPLTSHWLRSLTTLLRHACDEPGRTPGALRLLPEEDVGAAVAAANRPADTFDGLEPIHARFEAAAARWPAAVAVVGEERSITYADLDARADALAHQLRALGDGAETFVGVCIERSIELVVALLGVLKAGAAFVPLDPRGPARRNRAILQLAGVHTVVSGAEPSAPHSFLGDVRVLTVPSAGTAAGPVAPAAVLDNAAYVYFTSGSTGVPKGVVIDHRCAAGRLRWLEQRYRLEPGERVVQKTPLVFDVAVWEIFGPLQAGATVLLAAPGAESDGDHVADLLASPGTVFTHFVPSMLNAYLTHAPTQGSPDLRWVQCSGEPVPARLLERFADHFDAEFHNLYGQTETSEVAAWEGKEWSGGASVPIGSPIGIYRLFVLDEDLRPVPPGVPGELCVAGVGGLARGYHGLPALTADRFVPNPYALVEGERLYRTGDLAVADVSGTMWCLGRLDGQTKIRGCRVEVGEVEAVLDAHPAIRASAVVATRDDTGDAELVAYVVADGERIGEVATHVESMLPTYMHPAAYVALDALPFTPSGKLDRLRLPLPSPRDRGARGGGGEPRTPLEKRLCELWQDVLDVDFVGRDDNFFSIGGNSLLSLKMLNRLKASLGASVSVRVFFQEPTVAAVAPLVERALVEAIGALSAEDTAARLEELRRS